jgi:hypothetical protein
MGAGVLLLRFLLAFIRSCLFQEVDSDDDRLCIKTMLRNAAERRWRFVLKSLDKGSDSFATEPPDTEPVTYLLGGEMVNILKLYPTASKINGGVDWNSIME